MPLKLLKGIKHFKNNQFKEKQEVFASLSKGQAPDVLFFGCIDSRIDLRLITNANLGELLVARNPGNIVPPHSKSPSGETASSEFALRHIKVSDIIVCGHSHCGAMKGLMSSDIEKQLPDTANWLSHAKEALAQTHQQYHELNEELKLKKLTQNNILLQIEHLKTHPTVAQDLAEGRLKIHGWYYEFEKGEIYIYNAAKKKFISFEETVDEIALQQLEKIVKHEAEVYLNELTPTNHTEYNTFLELFRTQQPATPLWNSIKTKVKGKIQEELGDLYLTSNGSLCSRFEELLSKGSAITVNYTANKYQEISKAFTDVLNYKSLQINERENELLTAVAQLREHVLKQFSLSNKQFAFEQCMLLAERTKAFIEKVMQKKASAVDLENFKKQCSSFENNSPELSILIIILATIVTIAGGLLIAGISGAAIGATISAASALSIMGMWASKKEPIRDFACQAALLHKS